jgi:hypothetical protein
MNRENELLEHLCLEVIKFYIKHGDFVAANYVSKALASEWGSILHLAEVMQEVEAERELTDRLGLDRIYELKRDQNL